MRLVLDGYGKNSSVLSSRASGLTSLSTEQVKKNFSLFFFFFFLKSVNFYLKKN